jgi:hypothetical protein
VSRSDKSEVSMYTVSKSISGWGQGLFYLVNKYSIYTFSKNI